MNKRWMTLIAVLIGVYFIVNLTSDLYVDYLWFSFHGGEEVFRTLYLTRYGVHTVFALIFVGLFFFNFFLFRILGGKGRIFSNNILDRLQIPVLGSPRRALMLILSAGVVFVAFIMGGAASAFWKEYLMYMNGVPFEGFPKDPIFNLDIGFYVFSLPFYSFLYGWLMSSLVMITLFSIFLHILNGGVSVNHGKLEMSLFSRAHVSTMLAFIVILHGVSYRISAYDLLFSKIGKFYGAGYTAVNANLLAYNVAMVLSFVAAALLLFNIIKRSFALPLIVIAALIPAYFILGTIYPSLQQRFIVEPNELQKEMPYIKNNIKFTRLGYNIEQIKESEFANDGNLSYSDLRKNRAIVDNIRLWDWRPLKQTYRQMQELKRYYNFNDVDVGRYTVNGKTIAVNLSARELSINNLSENSQTWQNKHLIYTHGYGLVLSRVDKVTSQGQPKLLIYDIPPKTDIDIPLRRPEIYYGENNNPYIITNTKIKPGEFDYPSGDKNKYATYKGEGGIKLDSLLDRLMFASAFNDINILITGEITQESRVHMRRNITEMARTFAPYLSLDPDPYLVIADGRLFWMIDAYTTTDRFPYSTPFSTTRRAGSLNYIRNSVKIVIDAYNGRMNLYRANKQDPIIRAYEKMFPGVIKDLSEMPEYLQEHIRYPEAIFNIQSEMLLTYHMTEPTVFYNNEDAWHRPRQIYQGSEEPVQSYYMITRLPGEERNEFILYLPFTPYDKNNMLAFLAAKCDPHNYGELSLYQLPKDKLTYGPLQIEARIDQEPDISRQLTLWSQKGSRIIRGNMLALPIEESILYIEPLYLEAESSEMPELIRVIVAFNDQIVMAPNLPSALEKVFIGMTTDEEETYVEGAPVSLRDLIQKANNYYQRAQDSLKKGEWKEYGDQLNNLKDTLKRMKETSNRR